MEITINGNLTINAGNIEEAAEAVQDKTELPVVNHDEDVLIDNSTTFRGLLDTLRGCPEAVNAEKVEIERRRQEAEEAKKKASLGDLYGEYADDTEKEEFKREKRRPGAISLWNMYHRVASYEATGKGQIDVYANGYAVYDNGCRRTVIWVPDCGSTTYYFGPLRDNERDYLCQKSDIGEDILGPAPWYVALTIAGEDSIERNMIHPKSKASASAFEEVDDIKPDYSWRCGGHIETPEEALMRKETERERRESFTERQKEVYALYMEGYTQTKIAETLGISQPAVKKLISKVIDKCREIERKNI